MNEGRLNVLVACEESGRVTTELRKLGVNAFSADLKPTRGNPAWHIQGDCKPLLTGEPQEFQTQDGKRWYIDGAFNAILSFPPCTYFSVASACRLFRGGVINQERYQLGLEMRKLFMECLNANAQFVSVENVTPLKVWNLPPPTQVFQPYHFGVPYTKRELLWLRNLPLLKHTNVVKPISPFVPAGTSRKNRAKYGACKRGDDARNRSVTFQEVAEQMAVQWVAYMLTQPLESNARIEEVNDEEV